MDGEPVVGGGAADPDILALVDEEAADGIGAGRGAEELAGECLRGVAWRDGEDSELQVSRRAFETGVGEIKRDGEEAAEDGNAGGFEGGERAAAGGLVKEFEAKGAGLCGHLAVLSEAALIDDGLGDGKGGGDEGQGEGGEEGECGGCA